MNLNDWHVLKNKYKNVRHLVYDDLDKFFKENPEEKESDLIVLPIEEWETDEIVDIVCCFLLNEVNKHSACEITELLEELMLQANIEEDKINQFFVLYMKALFNKYKGEL